MSSYHQPVLLKESIAGMQIVPEADYVDVTFGGGGHSSRILENLTSGKLFGFDQDEDAIANAENVLSKYGEESFVFIESNFRELQKYLRFHGQSKVQGVLADLGVSSHQFNEGERGFSTRFEGPLDMRMDRSQKLSAEDVVNDYDERDLVHIFSAYGEIKNSKTLASEIVRNRTDKRIVTSYQLREIAERVGPKGKLNRYLAQLYQAIRIEVNDELGALKRLLEQSVNVINSGGRLVVISYHSLEDRLVKSFINTGSFKAEVKKDFYGNLLRPFNPVNKKPIVPTEEEINQNNRARSARLRIAERTEWQ